MLFLFADEMCQETKDGPETVGDSQSSIRILREVDVRALNLLMLCLGCIKVTSLYIIFLLRNDVDHVPPDHFSRTIVYRVEWL